MRLVMRIRVQIVLRLRKKKGGKKTEANEKGQITSLKVYRKSSGRWSLKGHRVGGHVQKIVTDKTTISNIRQANKALRIEPDNTSSKKKLFFYDL